jgi:hypothetical protein
MLENYSVVLELFTCYFHVVLAEHSTTCIPGHVAHREEILDTAPLTTAPSHVRGGRGRGGI